VKEWLVSLDYRIKDAISRGEKDDVSSRILEEFFSTISRVTEGVTLQFGGVEASSRQVYVITDDGRIPIEQVSQGMASLIGWVGVLVQRLHEVYGGTDPGNNHTLVLMDEIDAHMHPEWQQILIPRLREIFPTVQFIVSTHSPLVVAGRSNEEVWVFDRDEVTRKVLVSRPSMDFAGMRADQVLTSPAFGLKGARDYETVRKQERYGELLNEASLRPEEELELASLRRDPAIVSRPVEESPRLEAAAEMARKAIARELEGDGASKVELAKDAEEYLRRALADIKL